MTIKPQYLRPTCRRLTITLEKGFFASNPIEEIGDGGNF